MMHPDIAELLGDTVATTPVAVPPLSGALAASSGGGVAYDGSSVTQGLEMWQPSLKSADADILPEKYALDARARDTMRNDAYVAGGAAIHKDNIVGAYYRLNVRPKTKVLWGKMDDAWETEFQDEVETKFSLWAESMNCWPDAARMNTLTEIVRLAIGVYTAGGEVLASAEWMPNDGRPFRSAVQMIDTDRLSTPWNKTNADDIRHGVERDRRGAPIAYHIRTSHPNDFRTRFLLDDNQWKRVVARKPWGRQMILHIFEQMRPDQSRGIASMVTALTEMRMTKAFRKVELERAVVSATYAASIESDLPTGDVYTAMGAGSEANPTTDWMTDYLAAIEAYSGGAKNLHMNGSKIPVFAPGTHLKIQNPGANGPMGDKFEQSLLRHIAASLGVNYEQLSKDYSQTNYSSARAAMAETWRSMQSRKKLVADKTANFIYRLWMEEAINAEALETLKRRRVPNFYEGLNSEAYCNCDWIGAGQGLIEPLKETQADILALAAGLITKESVIARRTGGDWREIARQIARERDNDKALGLPSVYEKDTQDVQNSLSGGKSEKAQAGGGGKKPPFLGVMPIDEGDDE